MSDSLGWLTESSIIPQPPKLIKGLSDKTSIELKTALYESEQTVKLNSQPLNNQHTKLNLNNNKIPNYIKNPGIDKRIALDEYLSKNNSVSESLKIKAEIYDTLKNSNYKEEEDENNNHNFLIDFEQKNEISYKRPLLHIDQPIPCPHEINKYIRNKKNKIKHNNNKNKEKYHNVNPYLDELLNREAKSENERMMLRIKNRKIKDREEEIKDRFMRQNKMIRLISEGKDARLAFIRNKEGNYVFPIKDKEIIKVNNKDKNNDDKDEDENNNVNKEDKKKEFIYYNPIKDGEERKLPKSIAIQPDLVKYPLESFVYPVDK